MSYLPNLKIDGTLAADSPSLREALRWAGDTALPEGGLGRFALKARAAVNEGSVALSNVNAEFDGNVAEGVITFTTSGRPILQGTLAVETLDLTPYVSTIRLVAENTRNWDSSPIALDWFNGWEADLRLSAAAVRLAYARLGRTAVAATMRSGRLVVTVGESQSFGGLITGNVALGKTEHGAEFETQMQADRHRSRQDDDRAVRIRRVEGVGSISVETGKPGPNVHDLARNLDGTAHITARDGALTGVNVEQLLRRLAQRPLSGSGDFRTGRTPFDRLNIALQITRGTATIEDVQMVGPNVKLGLTGTTSIPEREFDLSGTASLTTAAADTSNAFELPFVVQGPWDDPVMLPDAQTLIRRSGAGAPLLDAVRDRRTRDAVESAIRRLTLPGLPTRALIGRPSSFVSLPSASSSLVASPIGRARDGPAASESSMMAGESPATGRAREPAYLGHSCDRTIVQIEAVHFQAGRKRRRGSDALQLVPNVRERRGRLAHRRDDPRPFRAHRRHTAG